MAAHGSVPLPSLGSGAVNARYAQDPMPERVPCKNCGGLGFVSYLDSKTPAYFNVLNLKRVDRPDGKSTWEGDCQFCKGEGMVRK